ncbi:hypothetical protein GCM10009839_25020 [Catenulispora yoronensis]|uniref:Ricin B lectin domain-containing protein n=2 Tax=Catenulispora yoronensis TaxID=450799 RepID=A0ABN2TZR4_9ACTN
MFLTYYGWWDNTPPGGDISYPKLHKTAGGTGTYADPITFATYTGELPAGTIVYVPRVGKYMIMEDSCQECQADWSGHGPNGGPNLYHIDMWIGGQGGNAFDAINCEDALTDYNTNGTPTLEPIVVNPPSNLAYDPMPLFNTSTGQCYDNAQSPATVGTYKNGANGQCIDDPSDSTTIGTKLVTTACTGSAEQQFTFQGAFLTRNNLCADYGGGSGVSLQKCTAGPTQQWSVNPNGTISDIQTGRKCIATSGTSVVAASCSGTAAQWAFTSTIGVQPDFSITAPSTATVQAGGSTTVTVNTAATVGAPESLSLRAAGFPTNGTGTFNPAAVTAGGSSTLTISVPSGTANGTYTIAATASGPTGTHTAYTALTVGPGGPPPTNDFSISDAPVSGSVAAGSSASVSVSTAVVSGSAESVALSASGLPGGATASFSPATVTAGGSSALTIATSASTIAGTYPVTIKGTATSATHTATFTLTVTGPGGGGGAIVNGGFESGTLSGWTLNSGSASAVSSPVHSGGFAALVGATGETSGTSKLSQTFTAPTGSSTLSLWYSVRCTDTSSGFATVFLVDNTTSSSTRLLNRVCTNGQGWKSLSASVTAGHSYTLQLESRDDGVSGTPSNAVYDDITVS